MSPFRPLFGSVPETEEDSFQPMNALVLAQDPFSAIAAFSRENSGRVDQTIEAELVEDGDAPIDVEGVESGGLGPSAVSAEGMAREAERSVGFEQGRQEGLEAARGEVAERLEKIDELARRLQLVREDVFSRSIKDLADAVHLISRQVIRRELAVQPAGLESLISSVLERVRGDDRLVLHIGPEDEQSLQDHQPDLLDRLRRDTPFSLEVDPALEAGGVVLETSYGRVDASIEAQFTAFAENIDAWVKEQVELTDG